MAGMARRGAAGGKATIAARGRGAAKRGLSERPGSSG